MDWVSEAPPGFESLAGAGDLIDNGEAHIKAITETGGEILGIRPLDADGIEGLIRVSHRAGGTVHLLRGATRLRAATAEEAATLPVLATWGYRSITVKAEARFVGRGPRRRMAAVIRVIEAHPALRLRSRLITRVFEATCRQVMRLAITRVSGRSSQACGDASPTERPPFGSARIRRSELIVMTACPSAITPLSPITAWRSATQVTARGDRPASMAARSSAVTGRLPADTPIWWSPSRPRRSTTCNTS